MLGYIKILHEYSDIFYLNTTGYKMFPLSKKYQTLMEALVFQDWS